MPQGKTKVIEFIELRINDNVFLFNRDEREYLLDVLNYFYYPIAQPPSITKDDLLEIRNKCFHKINDEDLLAFEIRRRFRRVLRKIFKKTINALPTLDTSIELQRTDPGSVGEPVWEGIPPAPEPAPVPEEETKVAEYKPEEKNISKYYYIAGAGMVVLVIILIIAISSNKEVQ